MAFWSWSRTAATNATADSTINYSEGQAPSTINDSARAMMARLSEYRDDIAGAIVTGGSSTAYTVTSFQVFDTLAHMSGQVIAFTPHATNTNAVAVDITLNVDGLGAKSIRAAPNVALPNGTLILGTPYIVVYNNSDAVFYLRGMSNPYSIPLAGGIDFWGTTAPNSSFAFPIGQALSRTTYATLFSIMSTTYGAGDGSTTFNLPDKTGRVSAMKEASATRLTSTYFVGNSTTLGATGGLESNTLVTANLPPYTPAGSVTVTPSFGANGTPLGVFSGGGSNGFAAGANQSANFFGGAGVSLPASFTGTAQGGISTPAKIVQPTIICNYILRII